MGRPKKSKPEIEETPIEEVKQEEVKAEEEKVVEVIQAKIPTLKVKALWKSFSPDVRPYKPSTPIIEFAPEPLVIFVEVPLTNDLILNSNQIMSAQLTGQAEPNPQFTPLGMRYIIDQFEVAMGNGEPEPKKEPAKVEDNDWDDGETSTKETKKTSKKSDDDEWEDEVEDGSSEKDEKFDDEDWEDE